MRIERKRETIVEGIKIIRNVGEQVEIRIYGKCREILNLMKRLIIIIIINDDIFPIDKIQPIPSPH